ncbi:MAG: ABC transporter permease [bacterium]
MPTNPQDRDDNNPDESRGLLRPPVNKRVSNELAFHIEMRTRELVAKGIPESEARQRAVAAFGDFDGVSAQLESLERATDRSVRRTRYFSELQQDVRFAFRILRRRRAFSVVAIATLALGIGAATAIYSIVDGVLLKPLPFADPDRLVAVWITQPKLASDPIISWLAEATPMGNEDFQAIRQRTTTLRDIGLWTPSAAVITSTNGAERLPVTVASHEVLTALRERVAFGRGFQPGDDALNAPPVALVSHEAWETRYGADSAVLGRSVSVEGTAFRIVGVLPAGLRVDRTAEPTPYWLPALRDSGDIPARHNRNYRAIARLAPGATPRGAAQQTAQILRSINNDTTLRARVVELQVDETRKARQPLFLLLGAAGLLMLIACVNVAVLLLGEGSVRAKEFAARAALGAGSARLARQLLAESIVIAFAGAIVGSGVAWVMMRGLVSLAPDHLPGIDAVGLDVRVLAFTISCAVATGVLFGIVPAVTAARTRAASLMRTGTGQSARGLPGLQRTLIGVELALSMMLLVGASLLARSLDKLTTVDPGFNADGLTTATITLPWPRYRADNDIRTLGLELYRRISALPGVERVSLSSSAPFVGGASSSPVALEGHEYRGGDQPLHTQQRYVLPGYFELLGMHLIAGRLFQDGDRDGAEPVAIVSAAEVQRDFAGRSPLGLRVKQQGTWRRIVGVVADVKYHGLAIQDEATIYVPFQQNPNGAFYFVIRAPSGVAIEPAVKAILRDLEPNAVVRRVVAMNTAVAQSYASERYRTTLVSAFGVMAALLAAVGMYGVTARAAASRTREMGIRLALGGTSGGVMRLMLREAMTGVAVGLAAGIPAALLGGRIVAPYLFDVTPSDPVSFGGAAGLLAAVTIAATAGPARRAGTVQPASVLRGD